MLSLSSNYSFKIGQFTIENCTKIGNAAEQLFDADVGLSLYLARLFCFSLISRNSCKKINICEYLR